MRAVKLGSKKKGMLRVMMNQCELPRVSIEDDTHDTLFEKKT